jgi:hypothetical protein
MCRDTARGAWRVVAAPVAQISVNFSNRRVKSSHQLAPIFFKTRGEIVQEDEPLTKRLLTTIRQCLNRPSLSDGGLSDGDCV